VVSYGLLCVILCLAVSVEHLLVRDGQTDGHTTTADTRASYSVARVKLLKSVHF